MPYSVYLISVYIHIVAAITWIGGSLFLVMAVAPALRTETLRPHALELMRVIGRKFRNVGWASLITMVVTGVINLAYKPGLSEIFNMKNPYMHGVWGKVLLVMVIIYLSALHDFHIGSKAMEAWEEDPAGPLATKLRKQARILGRTTLLLGLIVVALAVTLPR